MSVATDGAKQGHDARQRWRPEAACRNVDTALFFPNGATGEALVQAQVAKAVCAGCAVRLECLEFAVATNQPYGIFGGLTEAERKSLQRRRTRQRRDSKADETRAS